MKSTVQMNGNHAPSPPHSTEKTCYQGRVTMSPSSYPSMSFSSTEESGERALADGHPMAYTPIHGHAPTAMERGVPTRQEAKGGYNNSK